MTILLAEDDLAIRRIMIKGLETAGHTVMGVKNGTDGLKEFGSNPNLDWVITDDIMPEMTGIELLEKIRQSKKPNTKVCLMSGSFTRERIGLANKLKVDFLIEKPFLFDEFLKNLNSQQSS